jgi:hypothetical protein
LDTCEVYGERTKDVHPSLPKREGEGPQALAIRNSSQYTNITRNDK